MESKRFRLLSDAEFQLLSQSEKIFYLTKAIETIKGESHDVAVVQQQWEDTIPIGTRKPK
jgi:hypothetical protein